MQNNTTYMHQFRHSISRKEECSTDYGPSDSNICAMRRSVVDELTLNEGTLECRELGRCQSVLWQSWRANVHSGHPHDVLLHIRGPIVVPKHLAHRCVLQLRS